MSKFVHEHTTTATPRPHTHKRNSAFDYGVDDDCMFMTSGGSLCGGGALLCRSVVLVCGASERTHDDNDDRACVQACVRACIIIFIIAFYDGLCVRDVCVQPSGQ